MTRTIISLICLVGAGALFLVYTKPAYDGTKTYQQEITQYNLALDKAAELQRLKQSLLSRYNSFNPDDIEKLHKLLPDHVDNVRLVLDLDTLASKHGLALQNVVISGPEAAQENVEAVIGPVVEGHESLTLRFATTGPYERFVQFLTDLEKSLRIVDVVDLAMSASGDGNSGTPTYRFDITVRTYWLK